MDVFATVFALTIAAMGVVAGWIHGWQKVAIFAVLMVFAVVQRPAFYVLGLQEVRHVGAAYGVPRLIPAALVILAIAICLLLAGRYGEFPRLFLPFMLYILIGLAIVWSGSAEQYSGALAYLVAVCSWWVGRVIATESIRDSRLDRTICSAIVFVAVIQSVVSLVQFAGIPILISNIEEAAELGGRSQGTLEHPATLGKIFLLLCFIALPLTKSDDKKTRILASYAFALSTIPVLLSQGRANIVGLLILAFAFYGLTYKSLGRRFGFLAKFATISVVGLIFFLGIRVFVERNVADPAGGSRERFYDVAIRHLDQFMPFGGGPNSYVTLMGPFDSLTATGWPVHNFFLMTMVEVGIVGLILLMVPVALTLRYAWSARSRDTTSGLFAYSVLLTVPALYYVATSGWGLALEFVMPMWFFTLGYCERKSHSTTEGGLTRRPHEGRSARLPATVTQGVRSHVEGNSRLRSR